MQKDKMVIKQALIFGTNHLKEKNIDSASLDAEVLLLNSLNQFQKINQKNKSWLYAHSEYRLKEKEEKIFFNFIGERKKYKPVAYIIKKKEFFGLDFYVDPRVMIPRPETEIIIESVLLYFQKFLQNKNNNLNNFTIIDVGTGSGILAITLAKYFSSRNSWNKNKSSIFLQDIKSYSKKFTHSIQPRFSGGYSKKVLDKIYAIDISDEAIKIAKLNAKKHKVKNRINFLQGNLLEPFLHLITKKNSRRNFFSKQKVAIIANLPYLNYGQYKNSQKEIKKYEPKIALDGGKNGLKYIKNLFRQLNFISPTNCILWLEIDPTQADEVINLSKKYFPSSQIKIIKDLSKANRILKIKLKRN